MKMQGAHLFTVAFLALGLAACQQSTDVVELDEPPTIDPILADVHALGPAAFGEASAPAPKHEEMMASLKAKNAELRKFIAIMKEAEGWQDAHDQVQHALAAQSEVPAFWREQLAATYMLRLLMQGEVDTEKLDAIATYTRLLVKHRSPEGALVVAALHRLEGHWPEGEIAAAARRASIGVETSLAKRLNCEGNRGCPNAMFERMSKNTGKDFVSANDVSLSRSVLALDQLREMGGK